MTRFNLSEWALGHRSFVVFLMIIAVVAGVMSYARLGREEDPSFAIKVMVVAAEWPGATLGETFDQVTDRIEKEVQQVESLDFTRSYTVPGRTVVFVQFKDTTDPKKLPDLFYQVRKHINDIRSSFPDTLKGISFNDEFGDVFGNIYAFTSDGLTMRQLRDYAEDVRNAMLQVKDIGKTELIGTQDEAIYLVISARKLAGFGIDLQALFRTLQAQNAVVPSGVIQAGAEQVLLRVGGQFVSEESLKAINLRINDRFFRLTDVADVRRGYVDPPEMLFRYDGQPAIGLAIAMRKGGNLLDFGAALKAKMREVEATLPIGVGVHLVSDQPRIVEQAVGGFTEALGRGHRHRAAGELSEPRRARRARRLDLHSAGARRHFRHSRHLGHFAATHLARRADHRARASGRRCDDHRRDDGGAARGRRQQRSRGDLRLHLDRVPDADGHARHRRRLSADRLQRQRRGRVHVQPVRRHRRLALGVVDRRGAVRAAWSASPSCRRRCGATPSGRAA